MSFFNSIFDSQMRVAHVNVHSSLTAAAAAETFAIYFAALSAEAS